MSYYIKIQHVTGEIDTWPLTAKTDTGARRQYRGWRMRGVMVQPSDHVSLCYRHASGAVGTLD